MESTDLHCFQARINVSGFLIFFHDLDIFHCRESTKKLSLMERTQLDTETDNCIQYDSAKIDEIMYEKVIDSIGNSTKFIKFNKFH